ncbi:MAG TPA: MlaD family protein [Amycolatopsis sp.]|uniref:MlaD family protein n=1 Tax=Amycolatopsis sp. TaxID=37632 RepID=UPI002B49BD95|nr:MlaD family protein [Amycolatopsis sp.]HKS45931.1 MlaD family protein [Amycolatopsis sp.]
MLTRKVRLQVTAFVVIALAVVTYIGIEYAGFGRYFGAGGYVVRLELADGGGIFTNGEVTYRGVAVGRIGTLRLTDDGMEADLLIDASAPPIPASAKAVIANRSAVGEQFVDLQPGTATGPFLREGSVISRRAAQLPLPVETLLGDISSFNQSVPTDSLRTVVNELYAATQGSGPNLQVLMDTANAFTDTAARHLPQTVALIRDGTTVLRTQLDSTDAWRSFSANAKLFASALASSDGDLRRLIGTAPEAASQISGLLEDTDPGLAMLLANLLTTSRVFETRNAGLEQILVTLPKAVAATSTSITPDGASLSIVNTFFDPPPCTEGYEGTPHRPSDDTSPGTWNRKAHCALPYGNPSSVRGAQNAPKGGVPDAVPPGGGVSLPLPNVPTGLEEVLWPQN